MTGLNLSVSIAIDSAEWGCCVVLTAVLGCEEDESDLSNDPRELPPENVSLIVLTLT